MKIRSGPICYNIGKSNDRSCLLLPARVTKLNKFGQLFDFFLQLNSSFSGLGRKNGLTDRRTEIPSHRDVRTRV